MSTLKLSPIDADAHNDLGHIFENLNRSAEAEASYRWADLSTMKIR